MTIENADGASTAVTVTLKRNSSVDGFDFFFVSDALLTCSLPWYQYFVITSFATLFDV
ncbi:MAG: hypothetical protein ACFFD4_33370 [Candidatus Odinarchaeota archaeon]